jgi:hypothetical protein
MFQDALLEADKKDTDYKATGRAEGDFWGLPSCFKGTSEVFPPLLCVRTGTGYMYWVLVLGVRGDVD